MKKEAGLVVASGAAGGFFYWVLVMLEIQPALPKLPLWGLIPALMGLGGLAGYIGVFVIAGTDKQDLPRCIGVAIIFGLSWSPVISAAQAQITQAALQQRLEAKGEQLFHAQKEIKSLKKPASAESSVDIEKELK